MSLSNVSRPDDGVHRSFAARAKERMPLLGSEVFARADFVSWRSPAPFSAALVPLFPHDTGIDSQSICFLVDFFHCNPQGRRL